ncbi:MULTISPECIES: serine/threonine protein kinase [Methylomonas]|uniref:serine/threonine protein kinase n=1 Tax=Methylomonas TaxID=416 RepID=UPI001231CEC3|nr:serine/threonine-protein kinase [Methylomonas rhizoryzae]
MRCPACFSPLNHAYPCPYCGWGDTLQEQSSIGLPQGTLIKSPYSVTNVLGQGGFGITYLGVDEHLQIHVAIKEYFPKSWAKRDIATGCVGPAQNDVADHYAAGLKAFLDEARVLAKFRQHQGIVSVLTYFSALGTGYMVMEYVAGETLKHYLQRVGPLGWSKTQELFTHVLDAVRAVHASGFLHLDIAPDNIYLCNDGRVKLLDFGAARISESSDDMANEAAIRLVKPGFAALEQSNGGYPLGPWTDVYSLAACMYFCLTGNTPGLSEAQANAALPAAVTAQLPSLAVVALATALAADPAQRQQSVERFQRQLENRALPQAAATLLSKQSDKDAVVQTRHTHRLFWVVAVLIGVLLFKSAFVDQRETLEKGHDVNDPAREISQVKHESDDQRQQTDWKSLREQERIAAENLKSRQEAALRRFEEQERRQKHHSSASSQNSMPEQNDHLRSLCAEWGATMDCEIRH